MSTMKSQHGPFVPKRLKMWQPEHVRCTPKRRCHYCAWHKKRIGEMIIVLEAPMRFHFCSDACLHKWQLTRHDPEVSPWLRNCTGDRYKILKQKHDETSAAESGCSSSPVRCVDNVPLPVREGD